MGKAARMKKAKEIRVKLPEAAFFRLIASLRQVEVLRLEAREKAATLAAEMIQKEIAGAQAAGRQHFEALAKKHGFDPSWVYRFEEATCTLIGTPPKG